MDSSKERKPSWIDDPEKATAAVTASALAVFAVVHEMVPAHHQDLVRYLGGADFAFNVATWVAIHRSRNTYAEQIEHTEQALIEQDVA